MNNGPKYDKPVSEKEAQLIDAANEFFDGNRLASSVVVEMAHVTRVQCVEWMRADDTAEKFLIDSQLMLNPDPDEFEGNVDEWNFLDICKLALEMHTIGFNNAKANLRLTL